MDPDISADPDRKKFRSRSKQNLANCFAFIYNATFLMGGEGETVSVLLNPGSASASYWTLSFVWKNFRNMEINLFYIATERTCCKFYTF